MALCFESRALLIFYDFMEQFIQFLKQPWAWYVAGPLIGLTVPTLLILGNRSFGISASLRHICAACLPAGIPFFQYDWKKEIWNFFFIGGVFLGSIIAAIVLANPDPVALNPDVVAKLAAFNVTDFSALVPAQIFTWQSLLTLKGFLFIVVGGFLIGFGTRYAGGCTSGHAISGLSNLQLPSLIATISFFGAGIIATHFLLPYLLKL